MTFLTTTFILNTATFFSIFLIGWSVFFTLKNSVNRAGNSLSKYSSRDFPMDALQSNIGWLISIAGFCAGVVTGIYFFHSDPNAVLNAIKEYLILKKTQFVYHTLNGDLCYFLKFEFDRLLFNIDEYIIKPILNFLIFFHRWLDGYKPLITNIISWLIEKIENAILVVFFLFDSFIIAPLETGFYIIFQAYILPVFLQVYVYWENIFFPHVELFAYTICFFLLIIFSLVISFFESADLFLDICFSFLNETYHYFLFTIFVFFQNLYFYLYPIYAGKPLEAIISYVTSKLLEAYTSYFEYVPLIPIYLPLTSAVVLLLFSRFFGKKGALSINLAALTYSFFTLLMMLKSQNTTTFFFNYSSLKLSNTSKIWVDFLHNWEIHFDFITLTMCFLVTLVSLLVNFYAYNYLLVDPHLTRFFSYLSFFTFFMLFLVSSNNLIQFFFAWEGVGICSYLLIGFWSTRLQAVKSAIKAVLLNKVGDFCLLFAISYCWVVLDVYSFTQLKQVLHYSATQYSTGFNQIINSQALMQNSLTVIAVFFILAAVAKSAQIGLHTWLPDAMEGPTPVSALIHAATMVTAGILLVLRISPLLTDLIYVMYFILILGALTAIMSGFIACFQTDLKKIIAYSTCSQLGYMFFACGASLYSVSLLHLISHGFFKALLFLVAGAFIHMSTNEQASNKIYFFENIKLTSLYTIALYVGLTSLTALPFFSGFYSKEAILLLSVNNYWGGSWIAGSLGFTFGILAALLTTIYSASMLEEIIYTNPKKLRSNQIHKFIPLSTKVALVLLGLFSVFFGYYLTSEWLPKYNNIFNVDQSFNIVIENKDWLSISMSLTTDIFNIPLFLELLPLMSGILFTAISRANYLSFLEKYTFILYNIANNNIVSIKTYNLFNTLKFVAQNKFWFDYIINKFAIILQNFSYFYLFKKLDKGLLERIGPTFLTNQSWFVNFFTRFFNYNIVLEGLLLILSAICFYCYFML